MSSSSDIDGTLPLHTQTGFCIPFFSCLGCADRRDLRLIDKRERRLNANAKLEIPPGLEEHAVNFTVG